MGAETEVDRRAHMAAARRNLAMALGLVTTDFVTAMRLVRYAASLEIRSRDGNPDGAK